MTSHRLGVESDLKPDARLIMDGERAKGLRGKGRGHEVGGGRDDRAEPDPEPRKQE